MQYPIPERAGEMFGVPGRFFAVQEPQMVRGRLVYRNQTWLSESRPVQGYGTNGRMQVEVRFDDECGNGKQSFAITATIRTDESRRRRDIQAGGCLHEDIAKVFPELAHLCKWHLMDADGPMCYIANTTYLAGDRDCNGRRKGDVSSYETWVRFGNVPLGHKFEGRFGKSVLEKIAHSRTVPETDPTYGFRVEPIPYDNKGKGYGFQPKWHFIGDGAKQWHECPFDSEAEANMWAETLNRAITDLDYMTVFTIPTAYSEGKERELDSARSVAVWPDATDEQLTLPKEELTTLLKARLPALIADFRKVIEQSGFLWEPEQPETKEK